MKISRLNAGFTLLELLVVIAIIAVLAALFLPCLGKVKRQARMVEEMSAGRQLIAAIQMYGDDHNGAVFPGYAPDPTAVDNRGQTIAFPENARYPWRIVPYLAGAMDLIYSGDNRVKLAQLRQQSHDDYVYAVSVFPSLGINSYFMGGNETEFPVATANAKFGAGTVITRLDEARQPSALMAFIGARSAVEGRAAQGYYQVTPPYLQKRLWSAEYAAAGTPNQWGFVAPRYNQRAVAALLDGHTENFTLRDMQDMRHWCNRASDAAWTLAP